MMYMIKFIPATFSEETNMEEQKKIIDLNKIFKILWSKKKVFLIVWIVTFILSCIWIFPQPKYYQADVSLAPEITREDVGELAGIASTFGINFGGTSSYAITVELYDCLVEITGNVKHPNQYQVGVQSMKKLVLAADDLLGDINSERCAIVHQEQDGKSRKIANIIVPLTNIITY